jgi:hypothetical protein
MIHSGVDRLATRVSLALLVLSGAAGCLSTEGVLEGEGSEPEVEVTAQALTPACGPEFKTCAPRPWPNGRIPYIIESGFTQTELGWLYAAMDGWTYATHALINFAPKQSWDNYYVVFGKAPGSCSAEGLGWLTWGGYQGNPEGNLIPLFQRVEVKACGRPYGYYHELGHLIGLPHQHQRFDRDRYIDIDDESFCDLPEPDTANLTEMCSNGNGSDYGPYDLTSVMHYGSAVDEAATGVDCPNPPEVCFMSTRDGSAIADVESISPGDGSAVVEMYREPEGWSRFRPIYRADPGATVPLDTNLTSSITLRGSPALSRWGQTGVVAVVRGDDDRYYYKFNDSGSSAWPVGSWTRIPGSTALVGDPAVVSWGPGRLDVVGVGSDGTVWHNWYWNSAWGTWHSIGRPQSVTPSAPAMTTWGVERLDIFVRSGTTIYQKTYVGNGWPSTWTSRGSGFTGTPAAVSSGVDRIDLIGIRDVPAGEQVPIWRRSYVNGWGSWSTELGTFGAGPLGGAGLASRAPNRLSLNLRSSAGSFGGRLYNREWSGSSWSAWKNVGGVISGGVPAAAWTASGSLFIVARMDQGSDRGVWSKRWRP